MVSGAGGFHGLYKQTSKKCYCRSDDNIRVRYGPMSVGSETFLSGPVNQESQEESQDVLNSAIALGNCSFHQYQKYCT